MLTPIIKSELEIASELINDGFSSAKNALEQMLKTPIAIQRIDDDYYAVKRLSLHSNQNIQVLKTELRGDLGGSCYLIFTEEDVEKIKATSLLGSDGGTEGLSIRNAFIQEIDNIVAAAVVTEFANYLGLMIYGDVPELITIDTNYLPAYLELEEASFDGVLHYKAVFNGPELSIAPHFVWMFQSQLLDSIRKTLKN